MLPEQIFLELSDFLKKSTNFVVFIPIFIVFSFTHSEIEVAVWEAVALSIDHGSV